MKKLRPAVFWPPFLLLLFAVTLSIIDKERFLQVATGANDWILNKFSWLFATGAFLMVLTCLFIAITPLGAVRIGGHDAKPLLTKWRWFSITLCTTIAVGILFWATAEPLFHLHSPPKSLGIEPMGEEAARFALSSMYLHWTITPYAIYAVPAVTFALAYYNMRQPYSLGASLVPVLGKRATQSLGQLIDGLCLFALVAGMAASLGTGVLTLAGGLQHRFALESTPALWCVVTAAIVAAFLVSAASGLMKGIRILSDLNVRVFVAIVLFAAVFGPTGSILRSGLAAFGEYAEHFVERSLFLGELGNDPWTKSWTVFYFAVWLAWAPVTALFLGRIAYGYTVRQFLLVNLVLPSLFGCVWMAVFGGSSLFYDLTGHGALYALLQSRGPEAVVYAVFEKLPWAEAVAVIFVATTFLSYVTAADSNTEAMGGICSAGMSPESPSPGIGIKIVWGVTVGAVALVMITHAGVDGIKMLSNLGGLPALIVVLLVNASLIKMAFVAFREQRSARLPLPTLLPTATDEVTH